MPHHRSHFRELLANLPIPLSCLLAAALLAFPGIARISMTAAAQSKADTERCAPAAFEDWMLGCSMIVAGRDVATLPNALPNKLVIAFDGQVVRVMGLMRLTEYRRFFTNIPPIIAELDGEAFVLDELFFSKPPIIQVGGKRIVFDPDGAFQWTTPPKDRDALIQALRREASVEVEYWGSIGNGREVISVRGFSKASAAFSVAGRTTPFVAMSAAEAVGLIGKELAGTANNVRPQELKGASNPKGSGYFVHIPTTSYPDIGRPVWFVNNGLAIPANNVAAKITPALSPPSEVGLRIWLESRLKATDVLTTGLAAIGR